MDDVPATNSLPRCKSCSELTGWRNEGDSVHLVIRTKTKWDYHSNGNTHSLDGGENQHIGSGIDLFVCIYLYGLAFRLAYMSMCNTGRVVLDFTDSMRVSKGDGNNVKEIVDCTKPVSNGTSSGD